MKRHIVASAAGLLATAALGCGPAAARFPTSDGEVQRTPRRADLAWAERAPPPPRAQPRGSAEEALLVLSTPHAPARVRKLVAGFFRALVEESPADLDRLLAEPSWLDATSGRLPARNALRSRLAQLDFSALRGVALYRERDIEIYEARDARALTVSRGLPSDLTGDEVFVRVRLSVAQAGKARLFSDEVALTLRPAPSAQGFLIQRIAENTAVP